MIENQDLEAEFLGLSIMQLCIIFKKYRWNKNDFIKAIASGWNKVDSFADLKLIDSMLFERYQEFYQLQDHE